MRKYFIILYLCFSVFIIGFITHVAHYFTDGFKINKIFFKESCQKEEYLQDKPFEISKDLNEILSQPFRYLSKGRQSFVFVSMDDKYVIKLVSQYKFHKPIWAIFFEKLNLLSQHQKNILIEKKQRKERAFTSYKIANLYLKNETALVCFYKRGCFGKKDLILKENR